MVLQTAVMSTGAQPYAEAYHALVDEGKPMLVLVGADWCPACQTMKNSTLAQLERRGKLDEVSYVAINSDRQPRLAGELGRGSLIPQLVLYEKNAEGYRRRQLTGAQNKRTIESLVSAAAKRRLAFAQRVFKPAGN